MFLKSDLFSALCSETHSVLTFLKSDTYSVLSVQWNALRYIGKFDGKAAFGIYGLAATCEHNNTTQTLQPVALNINMAHTP